MTTFPFNRLHRAKKSERAAVTHYTPSHLQPPAMRIGVYDLTVDGPEFIDWMSKPIPNTKAGRRIVRRALKVLWRRILRRTNCDLALAVYPWTEGRLEA